MSYFSKLFANTNMQEQGLMHQTQIQRRSWTSKYFVSIYFFCYSSY